MAKGEEKKNAIIPLDDGIVIYIWSTLDDEEIRKIVDNVVI